MEIRNEDEMRDRDNDSGPMTAGTTNDGESVAQIRTNIEMEILAHQNAAYHLRKLAQALPHRLEPEVNQALLNLIDKGFFHDIHPR